MTALLMLGVPQTKHWFPMSFARTTGLIVCDVSGLCVYLFIQTT